MSYVNEAGWDRIARVVIGVALLVIGFSAVGGVGGVILGLVGLILLVTGLVGYCPIYGLLHVRTNGRRRTPTAA